jgi:hypothetical protein
MFMNLSPFKRGFVIGHSISLITSLSVGLLGYYGGVWVPLQPEASLQEEEEEMREWSSSLQDPSHKDFNPFKWNHTPDEFGYKK